MKSIYKHVISTLLLFLSSNLVGQNLNLFNIRSVYYPSQTVKESAGGTKIGFFELYGHFMIPQIYNNKNTILTHRFSYTNLRVNLEANPTIGQDHFTKHYHTISYSLGLIQSLNSKWKLLVNVNPVIASDFEDSINADDILYQGNAMLLTSKNDNLKYGFGLAYTTRFGRQIILPTGMLSYRNSKVKFSILFPSKASIMFNTRKEKLWYGMEVGLNGAVFNNNSDIQSINALIDETGYSRLIIGPALDIFFKNVIKFNFNGGIAVGRRLDFIDANEDVFNRTPETGLFFSMGMTLVPNKKKKP